VHDENLVKESVYLRRQSRQSFKGYNKIALSDMLSKGRGNFRNGFVQSLLRLNLQNFSINISVNGFTSLPRLGNDVGDSRESDDSFVEPIGSFVAKFLQRLGSVESFRHIIKPSSQNRLSKVVVNPFRFKQSIQPLPQELKELGFCLFLRGAASSLFRARFSVQR
jgi:hypothetical protein